MSKTNRTLLRNTFRTAFRSKERFLALFGIIAISTGFFAGLKVTSDDMKASAEQYYRETRLMDLHLKSNVGFCEDDLHAIAERPEIAQLYGGYSEIDCLKVSEQTSDEIVHIFSIPENAAKAGNQINLPVVTEGRLPEKPDECLIEVNTPDVFHIGDKLTIKTVDPESSILSETEFTAVGKADWSMFTDFQRGTTTVGNGIVDSYLLVPASAFSSEVYTDVFLTLTKTAETDSYSGRYRKIIAEETDSLLQSVPALSAARAEQIRQDTEEELKESRSELDSGWMSYEKASKELEQKLSEGKKTAAQLKLELDSAKAELDKAKAAYEEHEKDYLEQKESFDRQEKTVTAKEQAANGTIDRMNEQIEQIDRLSGILSGYRHSSITAPFTDDIQSMIDQMKPFDSEEFDLTGSLTEFFQAPVRSDEKENLEVVIRNYLVKCKSELQTQIREAEDNLSKDSYGRNALEAFRHTITFKEEILASEKETLDAQEEAYSAAEKTYQDTQQEIDTLDREKRESLLQTKLMLEEGELAYTATAAQLESVSDSIKWYVLDRNANPGWSSYEQDAERVDRIARIFPAFFLLVAALVCLTTMTRMVEEQRTEIGTCKALGYSVPTVSGQFLLYAVLTSVLGTAAGTAVGFQVFPRVIFTCYKIMYHYPEISCPYHWGYALGCLAAALLCTGVSAMLACYTTLHESPASLMRPRPPKKGKRILLERWTGLWSKFRFRVKITLRNIFRYRSRFLMTVIGICGCTALLLTGFGLYHSVSLIVDLQYGEVFTYDAFGLYNENAEQSGILNQTLSESEWVTEYQYGLTKTATAKVGSKSYEVTVTVPEKPEDFSKFINLRNRKTHEACTLDDNSIIINEKLAELLDIETGGSLELSDASQAVRVKAVMENYAFNRVFMTPALYEKLFGEYRTNCFYANLKSGTDENAFAETVLQDDTVQRLEFTSNSGNSFRKLVRALGYVVILVIVSSGLLAFAVLYNLANINIIERKRELATIKVLGYYDREVYSYIFRENIVSSVCGMVCGLIAGIFLCRYVVKTAEVDVVMFAPDIPWYCFACAAAVTIGFTLLINLILRRRLRNIDMAGSLKAVE
ncbi:MAG: FtsX-like permease family protein [Oscillospiraceae bacterium]|nr:FtsX-like permease family protein [Oscillospiraceae bacterium]